jgi:hypothetical protein
MTTLDSQTQAALDHALLAVEKRALTGDRNAVLRLVGLERRLRAAIAHLRDTGSSLHEGHVYESSVHALAAAAHDALLDAVG